MIKAVTAMFKNWLAFGLWEMLASLLLLTACAPQTSGVTTIQENGTVEALPDTGGTPGQEDSADPGAATDPSGTDSETQEVQPGSETTIMYTDPAYKFSVDYPSDFVLRTLSPQELAQLTPKPVASLTFMNPTAASSDIAELEPVDLEIRVYDPAGSSSLHEWLDASGLRSGAGSPQPFETPNISGLKLCLATMLVPNCSYLVMEAGWVYRLIPTSLEGEGMIESFKLIS